MGEIVGEVVSMCAAAAGVYLAIGLVLLAVELQIGGSTGMPQAMAHVVERAVAIVVCFVVAVTAKDLGGQVATMMTVVNNNGDATALWRALGTLVARLAIGAAGTGMALFVTSSSFSAQVASMIGQPDTHATAVVRIGMAVITGVVTLLSMQIANLIIAAVI